MRFGCCLSVDDVFPKDGEKCRLDSMLEIGYDYVELQASAVHALEQGEFEKVKKRLRDTGIKSEAFNVFIPGRVRITGKNYDERVLREYLLPLTERVPALGGEVIVMGSAAARNVEDGFSHKTAYEQLVEAARIAADVFTGCGTKIAVEPLNTKESNIINTVAEGFELAKKVNKPNFGVLADYYHIFVSGEDTGDIAACGDMLLHAHFADPVARTYPIVDKDHFGSFFGNLKKAGYNKRVSLESGTNDFANDAAIALKIMRGYFE
jgi:sugar phosphate isomerase/epimerase